MPRLTSYDATTRMQESYTECDMPNAMRALIFAAVFPQSLGLMGWCWWMYDAQAAQRVAKRLDW